MNYVRTIPLKKLATVSLAAFALVLLLAAPASADTKNSLCTGANLTLQDNAGCGKVRDNSVTDNFRDAAPSEQAQSQVDTIVNRTVNILTIVVGILAVFMIIFGGFRYITSSGNPENTKSARNTILYALVGLVIVAFAQIVVKFVLSRI